MSWRAIGKSLSGGFSTLHLGVETAQALRLMAQTRHVSRRINNRFGEGTSPRLRQIREGLDALGLDSKTVLHHATPRLFYACELGTGSRDALLGMEVADFVAETSEAIGKAWRQRWLTGRSQRKETLEATTELGPASIQASLRPPSDEGLLEPGRPIGAGFAYTLGPIHSIKSLRFLQRSAPAFSGVLGVAPPSELGVLDLRPEGEGRRADKTSSRF